MADQAAAAAAASSLAMHRQAQGARQLDRCMRWREEATFGSVAPSPSADESAATDAGGDASGGLSASTLSVRVLECAHHVIECVRECAPLREEVARLGGVSSGVLPLAASMDLKAATYAWRYLADVFEEASREAAAGGEIGLPLQQAVADHASLILLEPTLFFENHPAMAPALLAFLIDWLGSLESTHATLPMRVAFFQAVWTAVLAHEVQEDDGGLTVMLPSESDENSDAIPLHPATKDSLTQALLRACVLATKHTNLLSPTHLHPIRALRIFASIPVLARQLVTSDGFVSPWIDGFRIEHGPLGTMFRATTLPDDPSVGERFFKSCMVNGQPMPDMERLFIMGQLEVKLDAMHELLTDMVDSLLGHSPRSITRFGTLSWLSLLMLGNWARTKLRAARRQTSSDGFLLNIASVLLKVGLRRGFLTSESMREIDPLYVPHGYRLEMKDETRIATSAAEEAVWIDGNDETVKAKFQPIGAWKAASPSSSPSASSPSPSAPSASSSSPSPNPVASPYFLSAIKPHIGNVDVVCDLCRTHDFKGSRNKCSTCPDFDLCDACATLDYAEGMGLSPKSGVLFACPYDDCPIADVNEYGLIEHIVSTHAEDQRIVSCPVCVANSDGRSELAWSMFRNPRFLEHLATDHGSTHDPKTHVLLKCPLPLLHVMHRRLFNPIPLIPLVPVFEQPLTSPLSSEVLDLHAMHLHAPAESASSPPPALLSIDSATTASALVRRCADIQSRVVHHGVTCARCHTTDIVGVHFRCSHCADYSLCQTCYRESPSSPSHPAWHCFLVLRRPLVSSSTPLAQLPMNGFYPSALTGESSSKQARDQPNLETEWFMITMQAMHTGFTRTLARYTSLSQSMDAESEPHKIEPLLTVRLCVDGHLMQPILLTSSLQLYVHAARWMHMLLDPQKLGLPISTPLPMEFAALPEFFIEDLADYLLFVSRFCLEICEKVDIRPILHFFVVVLSSRIGNPFLRTKLVEVLCSLSDNAENPGSTSHKQKPKNNITSMLSTDPFIVRHLVPALCRLYVDVETTGNDKFNSRHAIAVLMRWCAQYPMQISTLEQEASDVDLFVRFVNAAVNDCVYLLDEVFIKATQLHGAQAERPETYSARLANQEQQIVFARGLRTASVLAMHTAQLIALLARHERTQQILMRPELVARIVELVNQFTTKVANPAKRALWSVSDPSPAAFKPDEWLQVFLGIYVRLARQPPAAAAHFISAVASDSSAFVEADFRSAACLLRASGLLTADTYTALDALVSDIAHQAESASELSSAIGDVPDDFLDPLLATLMVDPVLLPSGVTMDRAVIARHLLDKPTDPFNRAPLTLAQLVPNTELKQRIDLFLQSRSQPSPPPPQLPPQ